MDLNTQEIRHSGTVIDRIGNDGYRVRRDDGKEFGGNCRDYEFTIGDRVTFAVRDKVLAHQIRPERW